MGEDKEAAAFFTLEALTDDDSEKLAEGLTGESSLLYRRRKMFEELLGDDASPEMAEDVAKATIGLNIQEE